MGAKGRMAKVLVLRGSKAKTSGGLSASSLTKNKNGRVVSKKALAHGKKAYANIKGWTAAVQKARKALGVKGFVAVKKGTALQEGQGALPVSIHEHPEATAQGVGMSTPLERHCLGWHVHRAPLMNDAYLRK